MMRYSVTVLARSLVADRGGRLLVPEPRHVATLREARAWLDRMSLTWIDALLPSESSVVGLIVDDDGRPACSVEYPRDGSAPIDLDRDELREMRRTA
jgi:hypothetical protein